MHVVVRDLGFYPKSPSLSLHDFIPFIHVRI